MGLSGQRGLSRREDLVQTALARAAVRWTRLGDPEAYVRRVLYTQGVSWWRVLRRRRGEVLVESPPDTRPAHGADPELRIVLAQALSRLTPKQRTILIVRFYEDRTEVETAELLSVSLGTPDARVATGPTAGLPDRLVEPRGWTETVRRSPNGPASVVFTAGKGNVQSDFDDFKLEWWREGYSTYPTTVVGLTNDTYRIARDRYVVGVDLSPDGRYWPASAHSRWSPGPPEPSTGSCRWRSGRWATMPTSTST
jgi:RNA polymerase sigma factor (sigma-70 family)